MDIHARLNSNYYKPLWTIELDILHFGALYRMDKDTLKELFGEKTANLTKETTEDEIKRIYDERSGGYDQVLYEIKIDCKNDIMIRLFFALPAVETRWCIV